MTDHDALVRAVCEHPDDDTPRLIYADFIEERGEADRAAFVRAQVELARTPAWEPFAVLCRHRRPEWATGEPFRHALPPLPDGWGVAWPGHPFRRGFGWRADVSSLTGWDQLAPRLLERAPVGDLHLNPPATLDDWRRFAADEWVRRLRVVRLAGSSPVEPVRALCESPHATDITDIHFDRASSAGLPELLEDLLRTPLGRSVRGLYFRGGYEGLEYLIEALTPGGVAFERLRFSGMGLTPDLIRRWCDRGGPRGVTTLDLRRAYTIGNEGAAALAAGLRQAGPTLHTLRLPESGVRDDGVRALAACEGLSGLRRLDLSRNAFTPKAVRALAESPALSGVRSLTLVKCQFGDKAVRRLTRARFWPNLVELDLRENHVSDAGAAYLMSAPPPPDLTALLLDTAGLGGGTRAALRRHFGEALILNAG